MWTIFPVDYSTFCGRRLWSTCTLSSQEISPFLLFSLWYRKYYCIASTISTYIASVLKYWTVNLETQINLSLGRKVLYQSSNMKAMHATDETVCVPTTQAGLWPLMLRSLWYLVWIIFLLKVFRLVFEWIRTFHVTNYAGWLVTPLLKIYPGER